MRSWPLRERGLTRSAPACDALRGVCTTFSVVRGWHASGALALGKWSWCFNITKNKYPELRFRILLTEDAIRQIEQVKA
jgi:hypothetical protein